MTEKFLDTADGNKIYYKTWESSGQKLLLLHGGSGSSVSWGFQIPIFVEKGYSLVVPDLRGHGQSSRGSSLDFFKIDNYCQDIFELLIKEKIEQVVIVGHSFGGQIAGRFYQLFPEKVKALVLISSKFEEKRSVLVLKPMELFLRIVFFLGGKGKPTANYPDYTRYLQTSDLNLARLLADIKVCSLKTYAATLIIGNNFENKAFRDIKVPTLLIHGKKDFIFPHDVMEKTAAEIDNFEFVTVQTNHIILINKPNEVNQAALKFLEKQRI